MEEETYLERMMRYNDIYSIELCNDGFHIYWTINKKDIILKPEDCSIHLHDTERPYWYDLGGYCVLALNFLNGDYAIYDMY